MPSKKSAASQKMSTESAAPVVDTPPVVPVVEKKKPVDLVVDEVVSEAVSPLVDLTSKITAVSAALKDVHTSLKVLTKEYERMKKLVEKTERKRANARTQPSGFAKPTKISDEMCDFLEVPRGTELSRTDVTRKINAYVKLHNLNKPDNKRIILPDPKLKKILGAGDEEVSFFVLQRYIKNHFIKA